MIIACLSIANDVESSAILWTSVSRQNKDNKHFIHWAFMLSGRLAHQSIGQWPVGPLKVLSKGPLFDENGAPWKSLSTFVEN